MILWYTFFVISFSQWKEHMISGISFSKFSDVLPALTCAGAIGYLWSISLGINILILWSFCCSLKLSIFSTILAILFGFSFSGIYFY